MSYLICWIGGFATGYVSYRLRLKWKMRQISKMLDQAERELDDVQVDFEQTLMDLKALIEGKQWNEDQL